MTHTVCPGLDLLEESPGVFELVIDRPDRRNALTEEMMLALDDVVRSVNARADAVAVVVRGNGGSFCAGADLSVVEGRRQLDHPFALPELMGREADLLAGCEVPLVAVVTGAAVGLGMGLALSCDICVMEPQGFFAEAHLALGLSPTAMCWWLPRMAGLQRAADIILTGRRVYGEEAVAIGLAARLAPAGEGRAVAQSVVEDIARQPRVMTRLTRAAMRTAQDEEAQTRVRRFGGYANRVHRAAALSPQEPIAARTVDRRPEDG
jgi:enoyl-CoA hydratase/carnithine racemase